MGRKDSGVPTYKEAHVSEGITTRNMGVVPRGITPQHTPIKYWDRGGHVQSGETVS